MQIVYRGRIGSDFHGVVAQGERGFVAWAKRGQIVATDPVREPGKVWFVNAPSAMQAWARLCGEVIEAEAK